MTEFSETLKGLREAAGFPSAWAFYKSRGPRALGCTYKAYQYLEKGRSVPQPGLALRVAVGLGVMGFRPRVYRLEGSGHNRSDLRAAMDKALEDPAKIPIGVFYRKEGVPTYEELDPSIKRHGPPVKQRLGLTPEERQSLLQAFL